MADETKNEGQTDAALSDEEKDALAEEARKESAKEQEAAEAAMTDAAKEELAAKRGQTLGRDLSDHETALTVEEGDEVGFIGTKVDPLPNSAYTVAGVTGGTAKASATPKSKGGSGR